MRVLGVDLAGTKAGLALPNGKLETVKARHADPYGRLDNLVTALWGAVSTHRPELVVIEDYAVHAPYPIALIRGAEAIGSFRLVLWRARVGWIDVVPTALKKYATGKGNASKDDMLLAAQHAGVDPHSDDEADAYWLQRIGVEWATTRADIPGVTLHKPRP